MTSPPNTRAILRNPTIFCSAVHRVGLIGGGSADVGSAAAATAAVTASTASAIFLGNPRLMVEISPLRCVLAGPGGNSNAIIALFSLYGWARMPEDARERQFRRDLRHTKLHSAGLA